jgi:acetyl esterase/lipase
MNQDRTVVRTIILWLGLLVAGASAHAAHYGPYPEQTYQTCGGSSAPVAVLLIHGGAWTQGDSHASQVQSLCRYLGENGIYVLALDYRLTPAATWPSQLQDAQLGLRYLRLSSIATRVGAIGTSAGGHIALSMGMAAGTVRFADTDLIKEASMLPGVSDRPDFIVDVGGPSDLTDTKLLPRNVAMLVKGLAMAPAAARAYASPIAHLTSSMPPVLISHGVQDRTVSVRQSDEFVNAARQAGIPITSLNSGTGDGAAAFTGITYDRHPGGHVFDVAPAVQSRLFKLIVSFSKGK